MSHIEVLDKLSNNIESTNTGNIILEWATTKVLKFKDFPKDLQNKLISLREKGLDKVKELTELTDSEREYLNKTLSNYNSIKIIFTEEQPTVDYKFIFLEFNKRDNEKWDNILKKIRNAIIKDFDDSKLKFKKENNTLHYELTMSHALFLKLWRMKIGYKESVNTYETDNKNSAKIKKTLRALSNNIMNDIKNDKEITQYTLNTYANIITKYLLPLWTNGFHKLKITVDKRSTHLFEFVPPKIGQDFVSRFINGRETMDGLLHRSTEIRININPKLFETMETPDDAYNFFKSAIQYYDHKIDRYANKLFAEVNRLNSELKYLLSSTKLSGVIIYPLNILFVFDKLKMNDKNAFDISLEDINTINEFIRRIVINYASPETEKKKIIEDVKDMVKALREASDLNDNIKYLSYLVESIEKFYNNEYDDILQEGKKLFIDEQVDKETDISSELKYIREAFGVKKLKKIPSDLIAYIQIETEAIVDSNDKYMIASYTLSKLEIIDWYIELLNVGTKKYLVPHTLPYLETLRTQLLACYKNIMKVKITKPSDRPLIDIKYPSGYEG